MPLLVKKPVLLLGISLQIVSYLYTYKLTPGDVGYWQLMGLKIINTMGASATVVMVPAILSEIVDYSSWKYRVANAGTYYSIQNFVVKINGGVGAAIGIGIAGWYGFDATVTTQSAESAAGLMISMTGCPVALRLSLWCYFR